MSYLHILSVVDLLRVFLFLCTGHEKKKEAYENSNQALIDRIVKARGYSPEPVAKLQAAFA